MTREEWKERLGSADATDCGDAEACGREILRIMFPVEWQPWQARELGRALVAYARLLHDAGVTP